MFEHHLIGSDHLPYAFERQVSKQRVDKRELGTEHAPKQGELQRIDIRSLLSSKSDSILNSKMMLRTLPCSSI